MSTVTEKTTLYLDPRIKSRVQLYALHNRRSLSDIVNERLVSYLEDMADRAAISQRQNEPTESFEQVVKDLGFSLDEIQNRVQKERAEGAKKLNTQIAKRLLARIYTLADDPYSSASEPLKGMPQYRLRVGDYRIFMRF